MKLQALIFDKKFFGDRRKVKGWIGINGFSIDNRLKNPIMKSENSTFFRVRQRNPDWFNKKTFKVESLGKGVKGVYGFMKR